MVTFRHSSKVGPSLWVLAAGMLGIFAQVVLYHVLIGVPHRDLGIALGYLIIGSILAAAFFWFHRFRLTIDETGMKMCLPWVPPSEVCWDEIDVWFVRKKWGNRGIILARSSDADWRQGKERKTLSLSNF